MADQTTVVRMHSGNGEHHEMDERAIACFAEALDDAGLPEDPRLRQTLQDYFRWATSELATYHESADDVPDGLPPPGGPGTGWSPASSHQRPTLGEERADVGDLRQRAGGAERRVPERAADAVARPRPDVGVGTSRKGHPPRRRS